MRSHAIRIDSGLSKLWVRAESGRPSKIVRWKCSCGRIGPERLVTHDESIGYRSARNGGARHVAAMEKSK